MTPSTSSGPSAEALLKELALEQGFQLAGIASLSQTPEHLPYLNEWLELGYAGEMAYLERQKDKRLDPALVLPGAKSMLCLGLLYNTGHPLSIEGPRRPWVSRYAWGDDYHGVLQQKLKGLEAAIRRALPGDYAMKSYGDTGPVSEKAWAAAAGLGWVGKNTNLIAGEKGSWFFLAEILLTLDLRPDAPAKDLCGSCRKCLDACPTDAFPEPYVLDARRCVSYLNIEKRGEIPEDLQQGIGYNLYGCDICQDVCPWNHWKLLSPEPAFQPRPENLKPDLDKLRNLADDEFSRLYHGSAMKRTKAEGLRRNARIVRKNRDFQG
jgi:epoxyqueuosine reductase